MYPLNERARRREAGNQGIENIEIYLSAINKRYKGLLIFWDRHIQRGSGSWEIRDMTFNAIFLHQNLKTFCLKYVIEEVFISDDFLGMIRMILDSVLSHGG